MACLERSLNGLPWELANGSTCYMGFFLHLHSKADAWITSHYKGSQKVVVLPGGRMQRESQIMRILYLASVRKIKGTILGYQLTICKTIPFFHYYWITATLQKGTIFSKETPWVSFFQWMLHEMNIHILPNCFILHSKKSQANHALPT